MVRIDYVYKVGGGPETPGFSFVESLDDEEAKKELLAQLKRVAGAKLVRVTRVNTPTTIPVPDAKPKPFPRRA